MLLFSLVFTCIIGAAGIANAIVGGMPWRGPDYWIEIHGAERVLCGVMGVALQAAAMAVAFGVTR